jgi:hypothetical protein
MARSSAFSDRFDEAAFRSAIGETLLMGMPEAVADRLTWVWERDRTYVPDDPAGDPYDWTASPVTNTAGNAALTDAGAEVQTLVVPYAFEFGVKAGQGTVFGELDRSSLIVTLMDTAYEQVKTADYAIIGDTRYRIRFEAPPQGLFGVTVWTVYLEAEDSS